MKPFLLLQLRPIDQASDKEFEAFLKYGELKEEDVVRIRMEKEGIPEIDLDDFSGIIIGGGPSNVSDALNKKDDYQKRFENDLNRLFDLVFEKDFPVMGVCYGIGAITKYKGGLVSKEKYSERVGAIKVKLTESGKNDKLLYGLPEEFVAFGGHKEACQSVPKDAILLASSDSCPVQMIRFGENIYATQFHTELDTEGIHLRIDIYKNHGYFSPEDAVKLKDETSKYQVVEPEKILGQFVKYYKRD